MREVPRPVGPTMPIDRQAAESILRPVGGVEEIQVVGALDETIIRRCGVETAARSVWLHPSVVRHIEAQHGVDRRDAEFALQFLPSAVLRPDFFGRDDRDSRGRRVDLVHLVKRVAGRPLYVALKFVSAIEAESAADEIWVSTAYPVSRGFLTRRRYKHRIAADL